MTGTLLRVGLLFAGNDVDRIYGDAVISWYLARAWERAGCDVWRISSTEKSADWDSVLARPTDLVIAHGVPEWQIPPRVWERARFVVFWWFSRLFYDEETLAKSRFDAVAANTRSAGAGLECRGVLNRMIELAAPSEFLTCQPRRDYESRVIYVGCYPHKSPEQLDMILGPATEVGLSIWGYGWEHSPYARWHRGVLPLRDIGEAYASADVVLGLTEQRQADAGMINNRFFEALGAGAVVVAGDFPALREHEIGRYVHAVKSRDEVRGILRDGGRMEGWRRLAQVGRGLVGASHTYDHRVREFAALYGDLCRRDG